MQHFVGLALRDGHGVEQDDEAAVVWFKKAASAGRAEAQYALALCCEHGIGTEKRWVEALGWFELAAAQGHAEAIERLEVNLQVPVREEVAEEKWCDAMKAHMQRHLVHCEQLALEGDACAMFHWARCHIQAWGMPPNLPLGAQWMAKAAAKRHRAACYELGRLFQLENTRRKHTQATLYFQLAAEKGHSGAMFELGMGYRKGRGVEKDPEQSIVYLRAAAEKYVPAPACEYQCAHADYHCPHCDMPTRAASNSALLAIISPLLALEVPTERTRVCASARVPATAAPVVQGPRARAVRAVARVPRR